MVRKLDRKETVHCCSENAHFHDCGSRDAVGHRSFGCLVRFHFQELLSALWFFGKSLPCFTDEDTYFFFLCLQLFHTPITQPFILSN